MGCSSGWCGSDVAARCAALTAISPSERPTQLGNTSTLAAERRCAIGALCHSRKAAAKNMATRRVGVAAECGVTPHRGPSHVGYQWRGGGGSDLSRQWQPIPLMGAID